MNPPNILLIYTDQQRWDALGANGNADIHTPNLDRLAAAGCTFDHCCVQNPVCMPSRISMLSGQYPSTLGITHMGVPVPQDVTTVQHVLGGVGYRCANIGKLHFLPHANRDHRVPHPAYGFDHLEISDEPGPYEDAYRAWLRRVAPDQLAHASVGLPPATHTWYEAMGLADAVPHPEASREARIEAVPFPGRDDCTHTAFVATRTRDFLEQRGRDGAPFFCIAGIYSPHAPWVAPRRWIEHYDAASLRVPAYPPELQDQRTEGRFDDASLQRARQGYYAMVSEVDEHVGHMLDALERSGLADNTLVVFTSDHGEWLGDNLRYAKGYPGDDAVARVPLLFHGPGVAPGQRFDALVEAVDIVPTLLDAAGVQVPPHMQGASLWPAVNGRTRDVGRSDALMEGTGWKALRTDRYRYIAHADGTERLFDLAAAFGEYRDVAGDAAHRDALADVRARLVQRLIALERPRPRVWPY